MAERVMSVRNRVVDGKVNRRAVKLRVGTAEDAGQVCGGVKGDTYAWYTRHLATTRAPGPVMVRDEETGKDVPLLEPGTGRKLYPLDEAAAWHAERPGARSGVGKPTAENLRSTAIRAQLVAAAEAGTLRVRDGRVAIGDDTVPPRTAQQATLLMDLGILTESGHRYRLTPVGQQVRDRWAHAR